MASVYSSISDINKIFNAAANDDVDLLLSESAIALVRQNEIGKAYGLSKLIKGGYEKAEALMAVSDKLFLSGESETAVSLLNEARAGLFSQTEIWQQAELLCKIGKIFHKFEMDSIAHEIFEQAADIARTGQEDADRQSSLDSSGVLAEIAESIALTGRINEALEIVETVKYKNKREFYRNKIKSLNAN